MIKQLEQGSDENPDIDGFYLYDVVRALERMGIYIDARRLKKEMFDHNSEEED